MMPRMTHLLSNSNKIIVKKIIFVGIVFSMIIASSMSFGIMGVAKEFVPFYYGNGFEKVVDLYYILLPCCLFMAFSNVISSQFILPNHGDKIILMSCIFAAIVNLILNWLLIPNYGSAGTAFATLIAEIASCMWQTFAIKKSLNIIKYMKHSVYMCIIGMGMFLILYLINLNFICNITIQIIIKIIVGGIIFSLGIIFYYLYIKKMDDEDIQYMISSLLQLTNKVRKKIKG